MQKMVDSAKSAQFSALSIRLYQVYQLDKCVLHLESSLNVVNAILYNMSTCYFAFSTARQYNVPEIPIFYVNGIAVSRGTLCLYG